MTLHEPDHYEYRCPTCAATKLLTLPQINALEAGRFRKLPISIPPVISHSHADLKR